MQSLSTACCEMHESAEKSCHSLDVLRAGVGVEHRVGDLLLLLKDGVDVLLHVACQVSPQ